MNTTRSDEFLGRADGRFAHCSNRTSAHGSARALRAGRLALAAALMVSGAREARATVVTAVSGHWNHTCALTDGGGVLCWGNNDSGQLGDGTTTDRSTPVAVGELASGVVSLSAGEKHTCALTTGGGVRCWGRNGSGQLGSGTILNSLTPLAVSGLESGVTAVSAGYDHTCALTTGGGVLCWGGNSQGQLGDGTTISRPTPVFVSGLTSGVTAVSAGDLYTCALTTGGGVKCWGWNVTGQLGDGTRTDRRMPVEVNGLASGIAAVSAGHFHTCALTTGGGVQCWGNNAFAQLGDGWTVDRLTPVAVSGLESGVTAVSAGNSHTCALSADLGLMCWGANFAGRLGDGTETARLTPVAVSGLAGAACGVVAVSAGTVHTCALTTGGRVKCWGMNDAGQLGDGTTTSRSTPGALANESCGNGVAEGEEVCDGGVCCAADCNFILAAGTPCRGGAAGSCDVAETCDGTSVVCPADQLVPDGSPCDGGPCTSGTCQAGTCEETLAPRNDCRVGLRPSSAKLKLLDSNAAAEDALGWDWRTGEGTTVAELGGPDQLGGSAWELCVWDESGPTPEVLLSAEVAPGPGWAAVGSKGYRFSDRTGVQGGITQILAKAGADGRASVNVKGRGWALGMPTLPLALPARVQLEVDGGVCFEATFDSSGVRHNDGAQFFGSSD